MTNLATVAIRPFIDYEQNDSEQTIFDFPFPITAKQDLMVTLDQTPVDPDQYMVDGVGNASGGQVCFVTPPPLDSTISLWRQLEPLRDTIFGEGGEIRADSLNKAFDRLTLLQQDLLLLLEQCLRSAPDDALADYCLPSPQPRRALLWDEQGQTLINSTHDPDSMANAADEAQHQAELAADHAKRANAAALAAETAADQAQASELTANPCFFGFYHQAGHLMLNHSVEGAFNTTAFKDSLINFADLSFYINDQQRLVATFKE